MNVSELARHLQVSPTTVSRVLSGNAEKYRISAKTVERVLQEAAKLQVVPDPLGASLRRGKLGMVGLLVPDITNPFFSGLARAIERELRRHEMTVQLCDSAEDAETEATLLQQMLVRRLDGLILAPVGRGSAAFIESIQATAMPVAIIDRIVPELNAPSVCIDNAAAGRLAAKHLIDAGHTRIGCLRGDHESFTDRERLQGVTEAIESAGLPVDPAGFEGAGYSRESGLSGARSILGIAAPPSAIVALNGQGILGILQAAAECHLRIPADLSVVAFDEQPWSAFMNPPLTTVRQPVEQMAIEAVRLMLDDKPRPDKPPRVVLPASLEIRESVRR